MKKMSLSIVLVVSLLSVSVASAECQKTLMGSDCEAHASGTSAHMRGNAVENAKAAKELKAAQIKAKEEAKAIANAKK
jgi:hypothetical protein